MDLIVTKIDRHQIVDISIKDDVSLSTVKESDYVVMFQMPPLSLFQTSQPLEATFSVRCMLFMTPPHAVESLFQNAGGRVRASEVEGQCKDVQWCGDGRE